jgi:nucleoside-diphosphate-sugar epimerase
VVKATLGLLGRPETFGQAYNLTQDETPTLRELLNLVAERLGAEARLVDVSAERVRAAGLDPLLVSPFSGTWMSFLDPARAKAELGFRHEPLGAYLDKVVTSFLAHPPADPPPGYDSRPRELELGGV